MITRFSQCPVPVQECLEKRVELWLQGFAEELTHAGYAEMIARRHIRAAEHFMDWSGRRNMAVAALNVSFVEKFGQHLRRCRCPRYGRALVRIKTNGAHLFLSYLRGVGAVSSKTPAPEPVLLTAFHQWMRRSGELVMPRCTAMPRRFASYSKKSGVGMPGLILVTIAHFRLA